MIEVEFDRFNHEPQRTPMTKTNMDLSELLAKQDGGDFLRSVAEAVLQLIMEADVEGLIHWLAGYFRRKCPEKRRRQARTQQ